MGNVKELTLNVKASVSDRLDKLLANNLKEKGFSRSVISKLIREQGVLINGRRTFKPSIKVLAGDRVEVLWEIEETGDLVPQDIFFKVIWYDKDIIVISKPAGIVVHPGKGNPDHTLVNGLLLKFPEIKDIGGKDRPGIVHRLDKETSGLMIVARSKRAYLSLIDMIKKKEIYREYRVAALGVVPSLQFTVSAPIGRNPDVPVRMAVVPWGKPATTHFSVLRSITTNYGNIAMFRAVLSTGRTHQIRVHLRHMNLFPLGDQVYGNKISVMLSPRVFLHSTVLKFIHPFTGEKLEFLDPLPEDLLEAWKKLEVG